MMFRAAVLSAAIAVQNLGAQSSTHSDSAIVARALDAVRTFQGVWRSQWSAGLSSQVKRLNRFQGASATIATAIRRDPRGPDFACYFDGPGGYADHAWGLPAKQRSIQSKTNDHHWVCPNWLPPKDYYLTQANLGDEREWIDNALEYASRPRVAAERRALIQQLRPAVAAVPHDSVLIGQYVRMLVDNREYDAAQHAAEHCVASKAWCLALKGYVLHKRGAIAESQRAFDGSIDAQTDTQRCAFTRIGALLADEMRHAYEKMSCAQQESLNQTLWWLTDPLWTIEGNDRLTEQYARKITIALHAALERDERYNWGPLAGGDALAEMIERYGWMTYAYTGTYPISVQFPSVAIGPYGGTPKNLDAKLAARALGGYKTTYEYSIGRVHLVPRPEMLRNPFSITNDDWSLNAPSGTTWDDTFNWWPEEHYAPIHPLIRFRTQQAAFLRRQDSALFAYSTALANTDIDRRLGDTVPAAIAVSTGPRNIEILNRRRLGAQDRLTFLVPVPRTPSLVSVEVPWGDKGERGARSRFAINPPPALSEMTGRDVAISDPIILAVRAGATAIPNVADSAVALMLGSTTLPAGANELGVYWETYGIAAGDTVEVTVSVQRKGGNVLDRVSSVVGALANSNSLVSASWTEPQAGRTVRNLPGAVPIQMRSVILNISALPLGAYTLEVGARKRGMEAVKSSREFTIR